MVEISGSRWTPQEDDLNTLTEMGLAEMQDDEPVLTNEGHRALDWS